MARSCFMNCRGWMHAQIIMRGLSLQGASLSGTPSEYMAGLFLQGLHFVKHNDKEVMRADELDVMFLAQSGCNSLMLWLRANHCPAYTVREE